MITCLYLAFYISDRYTSIDAEILGNKIIILKKVKSKTVEKNGKRK